MMVKGVELTTNDGNVRVKFSDDELEIAQWVDGERWVYVKISRPRVKEFLQMLSYVNNIVERVKE